MYLANVRIEDAILTNVRNIPRYLLRPVRFLKTYQLENLRPDFVAGLTVGVLLLPQAIAYALIAELSITRI